MINIWKKLANLFDKKPIIDAKFGKYTITTITDHYPITKYEDIDIATKCLLRLLGKDNLLVWEKIIWEEDRWWYLTALISYITKKPFSLVKRNPIWIAWEISIDFRNIYSTGKLYISWVSAWDKVIIVEDMVDSWWTIIWLINLLKKAKIEIIDIVCLAVKEDLNWIEKIKKETWFNVKYWVKFTTKWDLSKVTRINPILLE